MKHFFTLILVLLVTETLYSGSLTIVSVVATPSVCFNDGSLTVNVNGGTTPYQYSIISGPVVQNVTYPISNGTFNAFLSLHSGTYVVKVTDNDQNSVTDTVTVPGNYRFPVLSDTLHVDSIFSYASFGLGPFTYQLSSVSPNGPFGPLQSDSIFPNLCNGTYYVRVNDSCDNFYTDGPIVIASPSASEASSCTITSGSDNITAQIIYGTGNPPYTFRCINGSYDTTNSTGNFTVPSSYPCPDTIYAMGICHDTLISYLDCNPLVITNFCSNFSDSTATLTVTGGQGPYQYKFYQYDNATATWVFAFAQDSGNFTHLPYANINEVVAFQVVDACGRATSLYDATDAYLTIQYLSPCPFNGTVRISYNYAFNPVTITCLTCVPQQIVNGTNPVFTDLDSGTYVINVTDACGETRDTTIHLPSSQLLPNFVYTSCNSVLVSALGTNDSTLYGCSFSLFVPDTSTNEYDSLYTNTTGIFSHLPNGQYQVKITSDSCLGAQTNFAVPYFDPFCIEPYFNTSCKLKMIVKYSSTSLLPLLESYSLLSDSSTVINELTGPPGHSEYFNINPGSYTLVSDSGCSEPQSYNYSFNLEESSSINCLNLATLSLFPGIGNYPLCTDTGLYIYTIQSPDTFITIEASNGLGVTFDNVKPTTYTARVYFADSTVTFGNSNIPNGNRTCLLDSAVVTIPSYLVPSLLVHNINTCDSNATTNIPFSITGGFSPYYVSIAGQASTTTYSTTGQLSNVKVGSYTMVVSDSCGISTSVSVSVVDTCISCTTVKANFTVPDSIVCLGQVVSFLNIDTTGLSYQWTENGNLFSTTANPSLSIDSVGSKLIQCIINYYHCSDTFSLAIQGLSLPPSFNLGKDTAYCDTFSRVLSSGIAGTQWSTGVVDSAIVVNTPGVYWAKIVNPCGTFADTITLTKNSPPSVSLGSDSTLCAGDSLTLNPHSNGTGYQWNNGSNADTLVVDAAGEYAVTVSLSGCKTADSILIQLLTINPHLLIGDTTLCNGNSVILIPATGTNPVWQDGSHVPSYTVSQQGLYSVTVNTPCGNFSDSVQIDFIICPGQIFPPQAFTPNGDGVNDYFTVFGIGIADYEIRIYNRWGELVYDSKDVSELNDLSRGWDGSYKGKLQNTATFVYYITAKGYDGKDIFKKGNLTLIR